MEMKSTRFFSTEIFVSLASLLIFNSVAVVGVLYWDWSSSFLLFSYWLENLAIGFFNVLKMKKAGKLGDHKMLRGYTSSGKSPPGNKKGIISFFIFHYGGFMAVHLIFLLFFIFGGVGGLDRPESLGIFFGKSFIFFIGIFISHLISYNANYIGTGEYERTSVAKLFGLPYRRIVPIHITIIFSALLGSPALLLIGIKIIIDILGHLSERRSLRKNNIY